MTLGLLLDKFLDVNKRKTTSKKSIGTSLTSTSKGLNNGCDTEDNLK